MLKIVFALDGLLALFFGLFSYFNPLGTYGTIMAIPGTQGDMFLSILSSYSIFYVLIGLVCLIGLFATFPNNTWIAAVILVRHLWIGVGKVLDAGKEWIIGDPVPDIIIHSSFIFFYIIALILTIRGYSKEKVKV